MAATPLERAPGRVRESQHLDPAVAGVGIKKRIFVSSTSTNLKEERRLIVTALSKLRDIDTAAMERFGDRPSTPLEESYSTRETAWVQQVI